MTPSVLVLTDFPVAADHALRYAEGLTGSLGPQHQVVAGPAARVLFAARTWPSAPAVLIARPHNFLGRLFHYSVTTRVIRHSALPLLIGPAAEATA